MLWPVCTLLTLYLLAVFARVVLSWFPLRPDGAMATVAGFLYVVTDPVMNRVRRVLPPARFGAMALDFSPILVVLAIMILRSVLSSAGIC